MRWIWSKVPVDSRNGLSGPALKREESRGAHFRADHPQMENIPERTFLTLTDLEQVATDAEIKLTAQVGINA